jgi:flagellar protein FliS
MFSSTNRPANAYSKVGLETGVDIANPHRLILMLLDGAILSLGSAGQAMKEKQINEKGKMISTAIDIISCGLQASVDVHAGGELSERLVALYDYMCQRLLYANLHNDLAAIEEVSGLLAEIQSAWKEIATDPAVVSGNKAAA